MSNLRRLFLFGVILSAAAVLSLSFSSCITKEQQEWNNIKNGGDIDALFDFSVTCQDPELLTQANNQIKKYIASEEDVNTLKELLDKYPQKEQELKDRITEVSYNTAVAANTAGALEDFIAGFENYGSDAQYVNEAKSALKNLYFNQAKDAESIEQLEKFIAEYGNEDKNMAQQAEMLIDDINWENAVKDNTRESYVNYIKESGGSVYSYAGRYIYQANQKIEDLDWTAAYAKATTKSNETLLPLIDFIKTYPNGFHTAQANQLLETMRNDSSYYDKYKSINTIAAFDQFIANFPGHKNIADAQAEKKKFTGDIYAFAEKGDIQAVVIGKSIREVALIVSNQTNSQLIINVPFGVYFAANSGNVQNMAVTKEMSIKINPQTAQTFIVETACMNIDKDVPQNGDSFSLKLLDTDDPLIKLLQTLRDKNSKYEVAQAAIWYLLDNPGKYKLMNTLEYTDGTWAITEEIYNEAVGIVNSIK